MAYVAYNKNRTTEIFVSVNNYLCLYRKKEQNMAYKFVFSHTVSHKIVQICQDQNYLLLVCSDDSLVTFDWQEQQQVDEWQNFVKKMTKVIVRNDSLAIGTGDGNLIIRYKSI